MDYEIPSEAPALYAGMFTDLLEARIVAETGDYLFIMNPDTHELELFAEACQDRYDVSRVEYFWVRGWRLSDGVVIECFQEQWVKEPLVWVVTNHTGYGQWVTRAGQSDYD